MDPNSDEIANPMRLGQFYHNELLKLGWLLGADLTQGLRSRCHIGTLIRCRGILRYWPSSQEFNSTHRYIDWGQENGEKLSKSKFVWSDSDLRNFNCSTSNFQRWADCCRGSGHADSITNQPCLQWPQISPKTSTAKPERHKTMQEIKLLATPKAPASF